MARKMTADHKEALARGRDQGRAVREYLAMLDRDRTPGRRLDRDGVERRIAETQLRIDEEPDPAKRVELIQRRLDLERKLIDLEDEPDVDALQASFVTAAKDYSERKGISYTAWREAGVPAAVLREAGIPRTRRTVTA